MDVSMMAARSAPRWLPANLHVPFLRHVGQADSAVIDEAGKVVPAREHVVGRLEDIGGAREGIALVEQPPVHVIEERLALFLPHGTPLVSAAAVDGALDVEERVDALDRLQRRRGDRFAIPLALAGIFLDVGQFEESPARMKQNAGVIGSCSASDRRAD